MNKTPSIMLAVAGVCLAAVSQAEAQTYTGEDLLLNFRDANAISDPDVTIDLGNVNTFVSTVASLAGGTAVLDSGSGFTATVASGLPTGFSYSAISTLYGAPATGNQIGFSAVAGDTSGTSGLLFLSRKQTSASLTPGTPSGQLSTTGQSQTVQAIGNIGVEFSGGDATKLSGSGNNAVSYPSGDTLSYQSQAEASSSLTSTINYAGSQGTSSGQGGLIEVKETGSAAIYEGLWEVPLNNTGGGANDTYEGYFTFNPDGEVDFTTTATAVPEPSTYALMLVTGALGFVFRRRIGALLA